MEKSFKKLNKLSAKNYNQQKAMIKKLLQGREQQCSVCQAALKVSPCEAGFHIRCPKLCTDIELDASAVV